MTEHEFTDYVGADCRIEVLHGNLIIGRSANYIEGDGKENIFFQEPEQVWETYVTMNLMSRDVFIGALEDFVGGAEIAPISFEHHQIASKLFAENIGPVKCLHLTVLETKVNLGVPYRKPHWERPVVPEGYRIPDTMVMDVDKAKQVLVMLESSSNRWTRHYIFRDYANFDTPTKLVVQKLFLRFVGTISDPLLGLIKQFKNNSSKYVSEVDWAMAMEELVTEEWFHPEGDTPFGTTEIPEEIAYLLAKTFCDGIPG